VRSDFERAAAGDQPDSCRCLLRSEPIHPDAEANHQA
jgi:hypothetical protein